MQPGPDFKASNFTRHKSGSFDAAIRSSTAIIRNRKPKFVLLGMEQIR